VEFVDHVLLGCTKVKGSVDSIGSGKLVVAFVSGVALDVEPYVQESLFCFVFHVVLNLSH
jgi:hypothetical protein